MRDHILETIGRCRDFLQITAGQDQELDFARWSALEHRQRGIYVIYSPRETIYVGKGLVRDRQPKHWEKARGEFQNARDTVGWRWLREHTAVDPETWHMYVITGLGHTACSALEGGLIHLLQPLANDEVYLDRGMPQ